MRYYHIITLISIGALSSGCAPTVRPPVSTPTPATLDVMPSDSSMAVHLRFSPGVYRYQFSQTARIQGDGATDTVPATITTRALIEAVVRLQSDSVFVVVISFDSITIDRQGLIPARQLSQAFRLDSIVRGIFSQAGSNLTVHLADSLCAYAQFITASQELLLPELGFQTPTPMGRRLMDTTTHRSCRAGTNIEMTTVRELRDIERNPGEIEVQQHTQLEGLGLLRRDSVSVGGSISSRGKITFSTLHRLPTLIQTESEGTISVRLGSILTTFRQHSNQETRLLSTSP